MENREEINPKHTIPDLYSQKRECCGCEACAQICPMNIIQMYRDNEGFFYPKIVEPKKCISCLSCERVCPEKHAEELHSDFGKAYAGWARSEEDIIKSSSGGFAYTLAYRLLEEGTIVYGVRYSEDFRAALYTRVDQLEELQGLRGSKYIQARKDKTFISIRNDLKNHNVLFIGTPCDCFALSRFIKDKTHLTIVSLICHGPTTDLIQQHFCNMIEKEYGSRIIDFNLRHKLNGSWKPYYIYSKFENNETYCQKFKDTCYNVAFLNFKRPSCEYCRFKKKHFCGDILIGDYHSATQDTDVYNNHGISIILPLTNHGNDILKSVNNYFELYRVPLKRGISQQAIHTSVNKKTDRNMFLSLLNEKGLDVACKSNAIKNDQSIKKRIIAKIRRGLWQYLRI